MATNQQRWVRNLYGADKPLVMLGLFPAGTSNAIKRGEMLKLSGSDFVPMTDDYNASADLAIANEEIKSGDRAGYYEIIVPRPGDVFEFDIETDAATAVGTSLRANTSEQLSTSGSNIIAYACGQDNYPQKQGHLTDDAQGDAGTTIRSKGTVLVTFEAASSYFAAFNK